MASELSKVILAQADVIEKATGADKIAAMLALGTYLLSRSLVVFTDVKARAGMDDQGLLDATKRHDAEAKAAWDALRSAAGG